MTKLELAQAIVTELYQLSELADINDPRVVRKARLRKSELDDGYELAILAATSIGRRMRLRRTRSVRTGQ